MRPPLIRAFVLCVGIILLISVLTGCANTSDGKEIVLD
jgi:predicted small secreted protein